jgi:hypothetical protein
LPFPLEFVTIRDHDSRQRTACLGIHLVAGLGSQIRVFRHPPPRPLALCFSICPLRVALRSLRLLL